MKSEMPGLYVSTDSNAVSSMFHTHSCLFCIGSDLLLEEGSPNTTTMQTASLEHIGYLGDEVTFRQHCSLGENADPICYLAID